MAGAAGAGGRHANAAGFPSIASHDGRGNALARHLAPFATSINPAALAGLAWGASDG